MPIDRQVSMEASSVTPQILMMGFIGNTSYPEKRTRSSQDCDKGKDSRKAWFIRAFLLFLVDEP